MMSAAVTSRPYSQDAAKQPRIADRYCLYDRDIRLMVKYMSTPEEVKEHYVRMQELYRVAPQYTLEPKCFIYKGKPERIAGIAMERVMGAVTLDKLAEMRANGALPDDLAREIADEIRKAFKLLHSNLVGHGDMMPQMGTPYSGNLLISLDLSDKRPKFRIMIIDPGRSLGVDGIWQERMRVEDMIFSFLNGEF